ncbi:DUF6591 domain-containing protein [Faecalibacillus faecis]|uniref:DUF6591 domain-containing protein n=1 Tax=Faecalibacillus faecis TaxID=1982628 RepID=UPI0022DF19F2|nr:DUF6591 domain-containing protein [Faecalibacillus faecis]
MKKIFTGLLCCLMLAGCGGGNKDEERDHSTTYRWSTSEIASKAPKLEKKHGRIENDSDDLFKVAIYDQSKKTYNDYVQKCYDAGFTNEVSDYDDKEYLEHYANTSDGYRIDIEFYKKDGNEDKNTLMIRVLKLKNDDATNTSNQSNHEESTNNLNEVSLDFKADMNQYEKFFDSYVDFMKAFDKDDASAEQLLKYNKFMSEYPKTQEAINNIDTNNLSDADKAYYVEVTERISNKLLELSITLN